MTDHNTWVVVFGKKKHHQDKEALRNLATLIDADLPQYAAAGEGSKERAMIVDEIIQQVVEVNNGGFKRRSGPTRQPNFADCIDTEDTETRKRGPSDGYGNTSNIPRKIVAPSTGGSSRDQQAIRKHSDDVARSSSFSWVPKSAPPGFVVKGASVVALVCESCNNLYNVPVSKMASFACECRRKEHRHGFCAYQPGLPIQCLGSGCDIRGTFTSHPFSKYVSKDLWCKKCCEQQKGGGFASVVVQDLPKWCKICCLTKITLSEWNVMKHMWMSCWLDYYTNMIANGMFVLGKETTSREQVETYLAQKFDRFRLRWKEIPHRMVCVVCWCNGQLVAFKFIRTYPDEEIPGEVSTTHEANPDGGEFIMVNRTRKKLEEIASRGQDTSEQDFEPNHQFSLAVILLDATLAHAHVYDKIKQNHLDDATDPFEVVKRNMLDSPAIIRRERKKLLVVKAYRKAVVDSVMTGVGQAEQADFDRHQPCLDLENGRGEHAAWRIFVNSFSVLSIRRTRKRCTGNLTEQQQASRKISKHSGRSNSIECPEYSVATAVDHSHPSPHSDGDIMLGSVGSFEVFSESDNAESDDEAYQVTREDFQF